MSKKKRTRWTEVDWHKLPPLDSCTAIVEDYEGPKQKIVALIPWDCSDCRGVRRDYSMFADIDVKRSNARLIEAAPEMKDALFILGGGSGYIEQCGRLCFCPNHGTSADMNDHATSCNDAWKAFAMADDQDRCSKCNTLVNLLGRDASGHCHPGKACKPIIAEAWNARRTGKAKAESPS